MGLFDDAVPGGNVAKPILIALGALLAGKMLSGGKTDDDDAVQPIPNGNTPQEQIRRGEARNDGDVQPIPNGGQERAREADNDGGLLGGGLGDLLERLQKQGQGGAADSWVKPDVKNEPIAPTDLGKAIGSKMLRELSQRTGISEEQLLEQLSKALPGVVDKLTPGGKVPSNDQVAGEFRNSPW